MKLKLIRSLTFIVLLGLGSMAQASSILNYSITGNGSGSLGGTAFSNVDFTINMLGEPDLFTGSAINPLNSASVSITGFGATSLLLDTRLGYNTSNNAVYFSRSSGIDLFDFKINAPAFDLTQAFAPILGTGVFALNQFRNIASSLGFLTFDSSSDVMFSASSVSQVPVPAAAWLFGSALLGFFGFSRKKANA